MLKGLQINVITKLSALQQPVAQSFHHFWGKMLLVPLLLTPILIPKLFSAAVEEEDADWKTLALGCSVTRRSQMLPLEKKKYIFFSFLSIWV